MPSGRRWQRRCATAGWALGACAVAPGGPAGPAARAASLRCHACEGAAHVRLRPARGAPRATSAPDGCSAPAPSHPSALVLGAGAALLGTADPARPPAHLDPSDPCCQLPVSSPPSSSPCRLCCDQCAANKQARAQPVRLSGRGVQRREEHCWQRAVGSRRSAAALPLCLCTAAGDRHSSLLRPPGGATTHSVDSERAQKRVTSKAGAQGALLNTLKHAGIKSRPQAGGELLGQAFWLLKSEGAGVSCRQSGYHGWKQSAGGAVAGRQRCTWAGVRL